MSNLPASRDGWGGVWEQVCQGEASDERVQILGSPEGHASYDLSAQIWGSLSSRRRLVSED